MRSLRWTWIAMAVLASLTVGGAASAQGNGGRSYSTAQIEQFVAPVALYPDALLAQLFMASTYPGEVVEASQWTRQNPNLQGDYLASALDGQNWDVSVKSMVPFPNVLYRMADNQAWTQDLGDAFLVQPNDVMNAVQSLRRRAYDAGNLRTSDQQRVVMEQQYIQIVPVSPQMIYVPAYNPMVVYGSGWGYPTYYYPTMMAPPPYYVTGNVISFGIGFAVGAALFGAFDWNQHNVYYGPNFYQYPGYHQNVVYYQQRYPGQTPGGRTYWEHDPVHRGPGGYHNPVLDQRYGHAAAAPGGHTPPPPVTDPSQPVTHREPRTAPPQPATHPSQPATHPQEPKAITPKPVTHPPQPAAHPQGQKPINQKPAAHPQHQQPAAHPQQQKPADQPAKTPNAPDAGDKKEETKK